MLQASSSASLQAGLHFFCNVIKNACASLKILRWTNEELANSIENTNWSRKTILSRADSGFWKMVGMSKSTGI